MDNSDYNNIKTIAITGEKEEEEGGGSGNKDEIKQQIPLTTVVLENEHHYHNNNKPLLLNNNNNNKTPIMSPSSTTVLSIKNSKNATQTTATTIPNRRTSLSVQSTQFTAKQQQRSISDMDSRCNTIDNQSDMCQNNINVDEDDDENGENQEEKDLFPGFVKKSMFIFTQKTIPRYWCLKMITSPWFERISMLVILINCVTLGMYQPCDDNPCTSTRCIILQYCDHGIYAFFTIEMLIKVMAMGFVGKETYLADTWNRLDLFIVIAGTVEYIVATENLSLSAIRTIRVLRPLRAINRVPSMRILVMLLLDTLPMLGNVLLLCFFVFFIFGIVGVQLWKGVLRNRCALELNRTEMNMLYGVNLLPFYKPDFADSYICTLSGGMSTCADIPPFVNNTRICNGTLDLYQTDPTFNETCINWNIYYTTCEARDQNPFRGAISFDNIGFAWVAIFQIISLESWVTIMYYIQDAHSFWDWVYFVFLIVIGSFFMINLCLVVIATQFSETKKRETERMIAERRRFSRSSSTIFSDADPGSCWEELIKYVGHLIRKGKRRIAERYRQYLKQRKKSQRRPRNNTKLSTKKKFNNKNYTEVDANNINEKNNLLTNNTTTTTNSNINEEANNITSITTTATKILNDDSVFKKSKFNDSFRLTAPRASPELSDISDIISFHSYNNINATLINPTPLQPIQNNDTAATVTQLIEPVNINANTSSSSNNVITPQQQQLTTTTTKPLHKRKTDFSVNFNNIKNNNNNNNQIVDGIVVAGVNDVDDDDDDDSLASSNDTDSDEIDIEGLANNIHDKNRRKRYRRKMKKAKKKEKLKAEKVETNFICIYWTKSRQSVKKFVNTTFFVRGILGAILINTLSMGVEHHDQPELLTLIVEYSNYLFTTIFLIEMLLKIFGEGLLNYIKNAYNMFDGAIVGLSVYELVKSIGQIDKDANTGTGVSVLRTFRLLRILKLVRFMPALRRQLVVMLKTIDNVATFFSLLILFMFIFSILGMNLFGCKFCTINDAGVRLCERKNFDSLLWSIITVFQVLTQEDWNEVLYNGMEKTSSWAALYFIALMTFGNYVLFNLLVAILVEGFSTEDEPKDMSRDLSKINEEFQADNNIKAITNGNNENEPDDSLKEKASKMIIPQISINNVMSDDNNSVPVILTNDLTGSETASDIDTDLLMKKLKSHHHHHPPIITHTSPTPIQTPSNSSCNSPLPSAKFLHDQKMKNKNLFRRKLSLDSASDHIKKIRKTSTAYNQASVNSFENTTKGFVDTNSNSSHSSRRASAFSTNSPIFDPKTKKSISNEAATVQNNAVKSFHLDVQRLSFKLKNRKNSFSKLENENEDSASAVGATTTTTTTVNFKNKPLNNKRRYASLQNNKRDLPHDDEHSLLNNDKQQQQQDSGDGILNDFNSSCTSFLTTLSEQQKTRFIESNLKQQQQQRQQPNSDFQSKNSSIHKITNVPIGNCVSPIMNLTSNAIMTGENNANEQIETDKLIQNHDIANNMTTMTNAKKDPNLINVNKKLGQSILLKLRKPMSFIKGREDYALYLLSKDNKLRIFCQYIIRQKWFDYTILLFIALNCITLAMERPTIPPNSLERKFLIQSNYAFTIIFTIEMMAKVLAKGFFVGEHAYMKSGWNVMDGSLVIVSLIDALVTLSAKSSPKIFGILRVFRLLRTLRPLRVISRAPGLKLVVQTLLSSLRPIGNIVLICCTFFIIFGILGVQLFKGKLYHCVGEHVKHENIKTKADCLRNDKNEWKNPQYNFDNLGSALMALFVLSSKDGWVQIMYTGIDAVGVDKQPVENYNEWMLLYFISFLLLVGFFVLNMFVGVVVENFHKCREEQEREEKARRAAKRAKKFEEKRRKMKEIPYFANYGRTRRFIHDVCGSKYFDLIIAGVIGLNVVTMSLEFYLMPKALEEILDIFNYVFTLIFLIEAIMRLTALGFFRYIKERWNQLDCFIVILSIVGILFDKLSTKAAIPINPTIIRVMRVLRIARVLKLLKMASGIRALLDTVIQALPQVGNLGLLFFLLFFIFAILGVELFGKLNCEGIRTHCDGLSKHAHFHNFGMSFLTLFRIATGDNWNGIMKDTLRENVLCTDESGATSSVCLASILAPIYFVIFVLMAQFVLVNVVVAVLMKHLDDSNKMMADDAEMDEEIEKQLEAEARNNIANEKTIKMDDDFENEGFRPLTKQTSLPPNFTFNLPSDSNLAVELKKLDDTPKPKRILRTSSVKTPQRKLSFRKQNSVATENEHHRLTTPPAILIGNGNAKKSSNDLSMTNNTTTNSRTNSSSTKSPTSPTSPNDLKILKYGLIPDIKINECNNNNNNNNNGVDQHSTKIRIKNDTDENESENL